jgi:hypothetical protein
MHTIPIEFGGSMHLDDLPQVRPTRRLKAEQQVSAVSWCHTVRHRLRQPLRATAVAACLIATGLVLAENSPYYVGIAQSFGHESNLLRLADGQATPAGASQADTLSSTALLAGIDQPFGRQRLKGDLTLRMNRFNNNDRYNNESYAANLGLDWATANRLSGGLQASANRNLSSFNVQQQGTLLARNYEDTRALEANARLGVVTQYSLAASLGHREVENTLNQPGIQARNFQQNSGSLGLRWQPSSLLTLSLGVRATDGRYPQFRQLSGGGFEADRFRRDDLELGADYQASGSSMLNVRLSNGKTTYDLATQRNFSGVTGSLNWAWQPTGKLRFNTTLLRDTGQESYAANVAAATGTAGTPSTPVTADYSRINTSLRLAAEWAATSKVAVTANVATTRRNLVASIPDNQGRLRDGTGTERTNSLSLGARWAPTRASSVGCTVSTDRFNQSGTGSLAGSSRIKGDAFNCYGQITLQ